MKEKKDFEKSSVLLRIAVTSPAFLKLYLVLSETNGAGGGGAGQDITDIFWG